MCWTHRRVKKNFVSQGTLDTIDQSRRARLNGRAELFRELRRKTVHALRVDKETYVREICEGVEHHLWSSDSHPAYRGIHALLSSKPIPRCTAVRAEDGGLLTEESDMKARWAGYFERLYQANPPAVELDVRGVTVPIADPPINCGSPSFVETQTAVDRLKWVKLLGFVASMLNFSMLVEMLCSCRCIQFCALPGKQASSKLTVRGPLLSLSGNGSVIAKTTTTTEG